MFLGHLPVLYDVSGGVTVHEEWSVSLISQRTDPVSVGLCLAIAGCLFNLENFILFSSKIVLSLIFLLP